MQGKTQAPRLICMLCSCAKSLKRQGKSKTASTRNPGVSNPSSPRAPSETSPKRALGAEEEEEECAVSLLGKTAVLFQEHEETGRHSDRAELYTVGHILASKTMENTQDIVQDGVKRDNGVA